MENQGDQEAPKDHQHDGEPLDDDEVSTILDNYELRNITLRGPQVTTIEDSDFKPKTE